MAITLDARVRQKTDTLANWLANPLILLSGEQAFVKSDVDDTAIAFKIGDGTKAFSALPFPDFSVRGKATTSTVWDAGTPSGIYLPTTGGTYGSQTITLSDGYQVLYWDLTTLIKVIFPISLAGYATTIQLSDVAAQISSITPMTYPVPMPFRLYTAAATFVTTSVSIVQSDNGSTVTMQRTSSNNTHVTYFQTGHTISETVGYFRTACSLSALVSGNSFAPGIGCIRGAGTAFGYCYRSAGDIIKVDDFAVTILQSSLATYTASDIIELHLNLGTTHTLSAYKNGVIVATVTLPENLTGELCHVNRGAYAVIATKLAVYVDKLAQKSAVDANTTNITALQAAVNPVYPFIKTATFLTSTPTDISWLKTFIQKAEMLGFDPTSKISFYLAQRAWTNAGAQAATWTIDVYIDTGDGSGSSKTRLMHYTTTANPEGVNGYQSLVYTESTYTMRLWIYWPAMTTNTQQGSMSYNAAGVDKKALEVFSSGSVSPVVNGITRLEWKYNNTDFATLEIGKYTVVPDKDPLIPAQTMGVTGICWNPVNRRIAIIAYEFAVKTRIWEYDRTALTPYSPSGTIVPTPTATIDITSLMDHGEGLDYDYDYRAYRVLGTVKGSAAGQTDRLLLMVTRDVVVLDYFAMGATFSFEPGMLTLYGNSTYIKPNNKTFLWEIDKRTKDILRTPTTFTQGEGLAINKINGNIWIGADTGVINEYANGNLSSVLTTFNNTIPGNEVEGMFWDPADDSIWIAGDSYLHGSNPNGNMIAHYDPKHTYKKFVRFPEMIPFEFGTVGSGLRVESNSLNGAGVWESPVLDMAAFTDFLTNPPVLTQNGKTITVTFRGSATAPTTTIHTEMPIPYYQGWGGTTPGSYSGSASAVRYQQIKLSIS